ncbi:MAG: Hpy99I family type II restriction endonuclease, partial [Bacteroidales bacterium]|nr:Hpy99I family type II restriction endonuclease [Bacteroidales bacterium]
MPNKSIFNDPYFPRVEKSVAKNDFVVNKESIDGIVPLSVGVVKGVNDTLANVYFIGKSKLLDIDVSNLVVIDVYKTGKEKATTTPPFKYKICNICFVLKNQSTDFDYNQNDKQGRPTTRPSCKSCRVGIDGKNMSA